MSEAERCCVVLAQSGRALASLARAAGVAVHVLDLCADSDTVELARSVRRVGDWRSGLRAPALEAALSVLDGDGPPLPVVYGGGFEDRPAVLARISRGRPVLGNPAALLARLADVESLGQLLREHGVAMPALAVGAAPASGQWLEKRAGGAGGHHVRWLRAGERPARGCYAQAYVPGPSLSLLAVGDGRDAQLLGLSRHWRVQPSPSAPFRHSGLVAEALEPALAGRLQALLRRLSGALSLRGLFGVDFVLQEGMPVVVDINARPPASAELHERGAGLFQRHVLGAMGRLAPAPSASFSARRAQAVLYAPRGLSVPPIDWPAWVGDRPPAGSRLQAGEPLCTVHAAGRDAVSACERVRARLTGLLATLAQPVRQPSAAGEQNS